MKASHGTDPCHLIVDATGSNVLIANFASGSVCVLPIERDGSLGRELLHPARRLEHRSEAAGRPARSRGRDRRSNRFVFVPELGMRQGDHLRASTPRTGRLTPNKNQPFVARAPGAGPRQLVMHPNGKFAYLINELNSTMTAYRLRRGNGSARRTADPADTAGRIFTHSTCAEVQIASVRKLSLRLQSRP